MTTTDGRATRWAEHNLARRTELVEATLRAIRKHGHTVGMEEIAASAGTSKTVFYRHFGDRNGLYAAVVESVHTFIRGNLDRPLSAALPPADLVTELADAYLAVVEGDVEIYRFVTNRPAGRPTPSSASPTGSATRWRPRSAPGSPTTASTRPPPARGVTASPGSSGPSPTGGS